MLSLANYQLPPLTDWQDFQRLCRDLFREEWKDPFTQQHGRPGHGQQGVDVFGLPKGHSGYSGVSCKNRDLLVRRKLTPKLLNDEVDEAKGFVPPLKHFVIAAPLPRDVALQRLARELTVTHRRKGLFSVHVVFWDDIVDMMSDHPHVARKYYPFLAQAPASKSCQPLQPKSPTHPGRRSTHARGAPPLLVPTGSIRILGLIALAPAPLDIATLGQIFPAIDWRRETTRLRRANLLVEHDQRLRVPKRIQNTLFPDPSHKRPILDEWIATLQPLRDHVDTAIYLSVQYICIADIRQAASVLVDVAHGLEPGHWNEHYTQMLANFSTPRALRRLPPLERVRFYNAYGLCLARGPSPSDALPWFHRLRVYSSRIGNKWGVGQSYINSGVALLHY